MSAEGPALADHLHQVAAFRHLSPGPGGGGAAVAVVAGLCSCWDDEHARQTAAFNNPGLEEPLEGRTLEPALVVLLGDVCCSCPTCFSASAGT